MSETTNVPQHKLQQQANAALTTTVETNLHGCNDRGHRVDKDAPNPVRRETTASAITRSDLARAARAANQTRPKPVARVWPFNPEDESPLAWWRMLPSDQLRDAEALLVSATLDKIDVMQGGDAFAAALRGDVAAAVAVALSLMPIWEVTLEVDLAMTAVLRGALGGDSAAALVLAHVLGRAEIGHPFATELSASWLTYHLRHSVDRRQFTKEEVNLLAAMRESDELPAASVGDKA